jgi:HPt (histidine-containing phosphotransfer) domain-containing protein
MTNSRFDFQELLSRVENDREFLHDLLLVFKEEFPQHREALREAVTRGDAKRIAEEAHRLKGMLSNLSAHESAKAAARLELLARSGERSDFGQLFAEFDRITSGLLPELEFRLMEESR